MGMFGFGFVLVVLLGVYWHFHTAPFRPLQDALAKAFPGSLPRVEGGQPKKHRDTPRILRIALRTDFDPTPPSATPRVLSMVRRIIELAGQHVPLRNYDRLDVYLYFRRPEQATLYRGFRFPVSSLPNDPRLLGDERILRAEITPKRPPENAASPTR
ncbi:MAG: hypothetical protein D6725_10525 [Planctomycetota bacterium]|nr:MAG: hypothetical protein D6725_10525 [Planctomycetota bacterium]